MHVFRSYQSREPCPNPTCDAQEFANAARRANGDVEIRYYARPCLHCQERADRAALLGPTIARTLCCRRLRRQGSRLARLFGATDDGYQLHSAFIDLKLAAAINLQEFAARGNIKLNVHLGTIQCYKRSRPDLVLAYNTILPHALAQLGDKTHIWLGHAMDAKRIAAMAAYAVVGAWIMRLCPHNAGPTWTVRVAVLLVRIPAAIAGALLAFVRELLPSLNQVTFGLVSTSVTVPPAAYYVAGGAFLLRMFQYKYSFPSCWAQRIIHASACDAVACNGECLHHVPLPPPSAAARPALMDAEQGSCPAEPASPAATPAAGQSGAATDGGEVELTNRLTTLTIDVPETMIPLMIGKGGKTVKKIVAESGAKVDVNKDVKGKVNITGTMETISAARSMILKQLGIPVECQDPHGPQRGEASSWGVDAPLVPQSTVSPPEQFDSTAGYPGEGPEAIVTTGLGNILQRFIAPSTEFRRCRECGLYMSNFMHMQRCPATGDAPEALILTPVISANDSLCKMIREYLQERGVSLSAFRQHFDYAQASAVQAGGRIDGNYLPRVPNEWRLGMGNPHVVFPPANPEYHPLMQHPVARHVQNANARWAAAPPGPRHYYGLPVTTPGIYQSRHAYIIEGIELGNGRNIELGRVYQPTTDGIPVSLRYGNPTDDWNTYQPAPFAAAIRNLGSRDTFDVYDEDDVGGPIADAHENTAFAGDTVFLAPHQLAELNEDMRDEDDIVDMLRTPSQEVIESDLLPGMTEPEDAALPWGSIPESTGNVYLAPINEDAEYNFGEYQPMDPHVQRAIEESYGRMNDPEYLASIQQEHEGANSSGSGDPWVIPPDAAMLTVQGAERLVNGQGPYMMSASRMTEIRAMSPAASDGTEEAIRAHAPKYPMPTRPCPLPAGETMANSRAPMGRGRSEVPKQIAASKAPPPGIPPKAPPPSRLSRTPRLSGHEPVSLLERTRCVDLGRPAARERSSAWLERHALAAPGADNTPHNPLYPEGYTVSEVFQMREACGKSKGTFSAPDRTALRTPAPIRDGHAKAGGGIAQQRAWEKAPPKAPPPRAEHADGTEQYVSPNLHTNDQGVVEMRAERYDDTAGILEGCKHVKARVDQDYRPTGTFETQKPCSYSIGPDLIPSDAKPNTIGALLVGLTERLEKKVIEYAPNLGLEEVLRESVEALKGVFTPLKARQWRAANPIIALMKSGKWNTERFYVAYERLLSEMGMFELLHKFQVKKNEVLPSRGKPPRPLCSDGDIGNIANLLVIKHIEDVLFGCEEFKGHFNGHHVKHKKKLKAVREIMKSLRHLKKHLTSIMGDGTGWDTCEGPEVRDVVENPLISHVATLLIDDIEVPNFAIEAAMKARKGKKMSATAETTDTAPNGRKLLSYVTVRAIRRSGDRGTSVLNFVENLIIWLTILSDDAPKIIRNPATRNHKSRLSGLQVWLNFGFEGDDSALSTDDDLVKYEVRIRSDWKSLGFNMKLEFCGAGQALTFVGYCALCDSHGPMDHVVMPELLRNIASSAWTCSPLAATAEGRAQIGAESYASRAVAFLETCYPLGCLFRGYALGHHRLGAKLTTSDREHQMHFTGEYDENAVFNLLDLMQDAQDNTLWTYDSEEDYVKLLNLQSGGIADLLDLAALVSIDVPLDPFDVAAARYFIPAAWRTDVQVTVTAGDNIEQQGDARSSRW